MVPLAAILYLALAFDYGYTRESTIYWPKKFHLVGDSMNLIRSSSQPFEIWYNGYKHRSRIDLNSGTVKRYYSYESYKVGRETRSLVVLYKVYPKSDEEGYSKMVCEWEPFKKTVKGSISDYLPSIKNFFYVGEEKHRGETVQVWKKTKKLTWKGAIARKEETLILRHNDKKDNEVFPVRYILKKYNLENGALVYHSIINYDTIETKVSSKDLTADRELCPIDGHNMGSILEYLHPDNHDHVDIAFHRYHEHHNKSYEINEYELRKEIFRENWKLIKEHNNKNLTYKLSMNEFADWTPSELEYLRGSRDEDVTEEGSLPFPHTEAEIEDMAKHLPENYNMITKGYISNVKHQDKCGSCWAFAATATVEGALARTYGELFDLSPQSMVDCAWQYSSSGCHGSRNIKSLFKYIQDFGIPTTAEYGPYLHEDGICKINDMTDVFTIRGFVRVHPYNANALKVALYKYGPADVGIFVPHDMHLYSNGVYYSNDKHCTSKDVKKTSHAVTVVGYGVRSGEPYWIVKNSWGEGWGQDGYILMSAKNDNCNLLKRPFYVIV